MKKITGGERGFQAAVHEALYGDGRRMHNPTVKWSAERGFFVESGIHGDNADEVRIWAANFSANTGKPYLLPTYNEVREIITEGGNT